MTTEPGRRIHHALFTPALAAMILAGAPPAAADVPPTCGPATLHDVQIVKTWVPSASTIHVSRWRGKKGKTGSFVYVSPPLRERATYKVTLSLAGRTYMAESPADAFWHYDPHRLAAAADALHVCVDGRKIAITRPDGKTYEPRLIWVEFRP